MHVERYRGAWFFLFVTLIALIAIYPIFDHPTVQYASWYLAAFNTLVILTVVYSAAKKRKQFWIVASLALITLVVSWIPQTEISLTIQYISRILFYMYAIYLIYHYLVYSSTVGLEEVYAAISLYLMLGIGWGILYEAIEHFRPGSFYISDIQNVDGALTWPDFIYFSFVTLTTLGYGDITPLTSFTRSLSILEVISGLFCLGILVAGAIGRFVRDSR